MKNRRITHKGLLLLLPSLALAAFTLLWHGKNQPTGEFRYVVSQVQFKRLLSPTPSNWRMQITVYLKHSGARPSWWRIPNRSGYLVPVCFVGKSGEVYKPGGWATCAWAPGGDSSATGDFDRARQEYVASIIINTRQKRAAMQPATFVGIVSVRDGVSKRVTSVEVSQLIDDKW